MVCNISGIIEHGAYHFSIFSMGSSTNDVTHILIDCKPLFTARLMYWHRKIPPLGAWCHLCKSPKEKKAVQINFFPFLFNVNDSVVIRVSNTCYTIPLSNIWKVFANAATTTTTICQPNLRPNKIQLNLIFFFGVSRGGLVSGVKWDSFFLQVKVLF